MPHIHLHTTLYWKKDNTMTESTTLNGVHPIDVNKTKLFKLLFDEIYNNPERYKKAFLSGDAKLQIENIERAFSVVLKEGLYPYSKYNTFDGETISIYTSIRLVGSRRYKYNIYISEYNYFHLTKWSKEKVKHFVQYLVYREMQCMQVYKRYCSYETGQFNWKQNKNILTGRYHKMVNANLVIDVEKQLITFNIPWGEFTFSPKEERKTATQLKGIAAKYFNAIKMMALGDKPIMDIE